MSDSVCLCGVTLSICVYKSEYVLVFLSICVCLFVCLCNTLCFLCFCVCVGLAM